MRTPPPTPKIENLLRDDMERVGRLLPYVAQIEDRDYLHWEQLRHRSPPDGLAIEDWWFVLLLKRQGSAIVTPSLTAKNGRPLRVSRHARIDAALADTDRRLAGSVGAPEPILSRDTRDRFLVSSMMEEAIHSSLYEGAVSTREAAKEMLRSKREPISKDERMILNNYLAMDRISNLRGERLSVDLLLELHKIVTDGTLTDPDAAGRFQTPNESRVEVVSHQLHRAVHTPPPAAQIPERMDRLTAFANGPDVDGNTFIHPVLRSILLHFQLAYDHPFADGNGRTARALFYWSMLRRGYWLTEFLSISRLLHRHRAAYEQAFQWVESDHQDGTYFVLQQLEALQRAADDLHSYVELKARQNGEVGRLIAGRHDLNHRQRALLGHALRHPDTRYTHESHGRSHSVSLMTARSDLQSLAKAGFLSKQKDGKKFAYLAPLDLASRLRGAGE
jgi:Fic family protein